MFIVTIIVLFYHIKFPNGLQLKNTKIKNVLFEHVIRLFYFVIIRNTDFQGEQRVNAKKSYEN